MHSAELRERAEHYRMIAIQVTDAQTKEGLLELAEHYEARAREMEQGRVSAVGPPRQEGKMAHSTGSEAGQTQMNPGDEAAPGTPGTAEDVCPTCHGSRQVDGRACENCGGTGRIIRGIGGA
jgi:hypothetical protein